jgi:hypothetical protein
MTYLSNYKKRVGLGGVSNTREKLIYQAKRQFEKSLQIDPSSLLLKVTNTDEVNISEDTREIKVIVNDYALNDQRAFDEKILLARIEDNVNIGCYVEFDGFIWLVNFEEHISVPSHKKFIMKKCNQILKYKYGEVIYDIPVVVKNLVQYSDGMQDIVFTSMPDSKRSIIYGVNYITKNIVLGDRLMLNKSGVYRVTHIDDFQYNANYDDHTGIATATIAHTAANNLDNFEDNLADNNNEVIDTKLHIEGLDNVMPSGKFKYNLSPAKYTDWTVEYIGKNKGYVSISRSGDDCILSIKSDISLIGSKFKLISLDVSNSSQAEKIIEVKGF